MAKIAVYGTLRKGYSNNPVLGDSKLISSGLTKEKYKLTASGIPFVTKNEEISNVRVEVYNVSESQLPRVDRLEGYDPENHDGSWYKRTTIPVILDNGEEIEAQIYFGDKDAVKVIESGDFADYAKPRF